MDYAKKLSRHVREIRDNKIDEDILATTTIQPETTSVQPEMTTLQSEVDETTTVSSSESNEIFSFGDLFESFFSQLLTNSTNDTSSDVDDDFLSTLLTALLSDKESSEADEDESSITAILKQVILRKIIYYSGASFWEVR